MKLLEYAIMSRIQHCLLSYHQSSKKKKKSQKVIQLKRAPLEATDKEREMSHLIK